MRIKNMENVITELRSYLPKYLESFGRSVEGKQKSFSCPNHTAHRNGDSNPSAGLVKGNKEVWNCFTCGSKGDIFLAAHYIENLPTKGQGFIDTVQTLAVRFGVEVEQDDNGEEIIKAQNHMAEIIKKGFQKPEVRDYVESRNFSDIANEFGIGFADPNKLHGMLAKTFDLDFINRNDLCNNKLLLNRMSFPIHDETGAVVAFASRSLGDEKPKYVNSSNSSIYQKSKILYNLHRIKSDHVYVMEGYADVWRCYQNDVPAVATCGTAFTESHMETLIRFGIQHVTFVFDGDEAGMKATERTLKLIENYLNVRCDYITLSAKDKDPDLFIRTHGKDAFLALDRTEIEAPQRKKRDVFINQILEINFDLVKGQAAGYKTNWHLYDSRMENVQAGLHLVGGISNIGKTAWMTHLALKLAYFNPEIFVLYVSIDDNIKLQMPRMIANLGKIPVNQAKNPKKFISENIDLSKEQKEMQWQLRERGFDNLQRLARQNFAMVDIDQVSTLEDIEREVHIFQEITRKPVALFLDNFHKVRTKAFNNFKERFTHVSEELKRITSQNGLVTFSTVELTKLGHTGRPDIETIKESVDIIYDAETIHMLHQDMHSKQGKTELYFEHATLPGKKLPILEVNIVKNKISGYKGRMYYKFFTDFMYFEECSIQDQARYGNEEV